MGTSELSDLTKVRLLITKMNEDPGFRKLLLSEDLEAKNLAIREIGLVPEDLYLIRREMNMLVSEMGKASIWVPT